MIFIFNANGDLLNSVLENVYQGSNGANKVYFLAPFPESDCVTVQYQLPDGKVTGETLLTLSNVIPQVKTEDGTAYKVWITTLNKVVTALSGDLTAQFNVISATQVVSTMSVTFPILKGVAPKLPLDTSNEETIQTILAMVNELSVNVVKNIKDGSAPGSLIQKQGGVYSSSGAIDAECKADGINAVALGSASEAHGDASFACGRKAKTYQIGSVAFGSCIAGNETLWKEILADIASVQQQYPIQEGESKADYIKRIYQYFSQKTKDNRYSWAFAAGQGNWAIGKSSGAVGTGNKNYAENGWTSGANNENSKNGTIAFIHGDHNKNGAPEAIILGDYNEAIEKKILENGVEKDKSNAPIILGSNNYSNNYLTVLLGQYLNGLHYRATLIGEGLTSNKKYQIILGQYNKESDAVIVFANGLGSRGEATIPKNLLELFEDGKALTPNTDLDDNDDDGYLVPKGYLKRKLANAGGGGLYRRTIRLQNDKSAELRIVAYSRTDTQATVDMSLSELYEHVKKYYNGGFANDLDFGDGTNMTEKAFVVNNFWLGEENGYFEVGNGLITSVKCSALYSEKIEELP